MTPAMAMAANITAAIVEAILMRPEFVIGARVAFPFAHGVVGLTDRPVRVVESVSISCCEVAGVSSEGLICAVGSCEEQPKKGGLKPPLHGAKKQEDIQWERVSWRWCGGTVTMKCWHEPV